MNSIFKFTFLIIFLIASTTYGVRINETTRETTSSTTPAATENGTASSSTSTGTGLVAPEIKAPEYKSQIDQTSKEQNAFKIAGGVVAAGLAVKAMTCWGTCSYGCSAKCVPWSLAAAGAAGVVLHNTNQAKANDAYSQQFSAGTGTESTTGTDGRDASGTGSTTVGSQGGLDSAIATLKKLPVKVDLKKGTVTTSDGKTYTQADMSSAAAMTAAGLNPADLTKIKEDINKLSKDAAAGKAMDSSDSADIIVGSKKDRTHADGLGYAPPPLPGLGVARDPSSQVAGLSKMFNGEQIGVSADSLFKIIDRRYELHKEKGSFLIPNK